MSSLNSFFTGIPSTWAVAIIFICVTAGGLIWQQAAFEQHVMERETIADRRFEILERDSRILLTNQTDIAVLANSLQHVEEQVDRLLARLDRMLDELQSSR